MTENRLSDIPDWLYLLREFYEIYRYLPSGGSSVIRAHQRAVREAVSRVMQSNASVKVGDPQDKPVTVHFRRALDEGRRERHADMIRGIDAIRGTLSWQYGYEKVPRGLEKKYAYAELCGPYGPVISEEVILGLVLFAPGCTYPAHAHDGITESYICLSGAVSENHQGVYAPGSMIFNPPGQLHRITVSDREPALMAYAWIGPPDKLSDQKMVFTRAPTRKNKSG
ncbi:MAG: dimethylsulfonioproprionate lyase family protein [Pseudomonadota bacterium]